MQLDLLTFPEKLRSKLKQYDGENAAATVAIIFREHKKRMEILLVKRADIPGDPWSGDMAFPGGKKGEIDKSIFDTANREVKEETGLDLVDANFLGMMRIVYSTVRPDLSVIPVVYFISNCPDVRINEELTSYHWVPVTKLENLRGRAVVKNRDVPVFHLNGENVWGLTYRILQYLLELIGD